MCGNNAKVLYDVFSGLSFMEICEDCLDEFNKGQEIKYYAD